MDLLAGVELAVSLAFASVAQLSTAELAAMQSQSRPLVVLDVRAPAEFAVSHIPGAVHFDPQPLQSAATRVNQVLNAADIPTGQPVTVVVYCSVGWRSSAFARALAQQPFPGDRRVRIMNLGGSLFRWALENRPLVNADGPTRRVHGFNPVWARLLPPERVVLDESSPPVAH